MWLYFHACGFIHDVVFSIFPLMQVGGGNTIAPFRTSYLPYKPSISVFTGRHMTISYAAAANLSVVDL